MWRAFDETGRLQLPGLHRDRRCGIVPMYWVRVVGGTLYIVGVLLLRLQPAA